LYFSGFCLTNEQELFSKYLQNNNFTVSGFSFGAIKVVEYTIQAIENKQRIDKIQLFSPAYFVDKDKKYKRLQLLHFKKNQQQYIDNFIQNIAYPSKINLTKYISNGTYDELEILLNYTWDKSTLKQIINNNIKIEVFLGSDDIIINSLLAKQFFKEFATVYLIKNSGHILHEPN